MKMTACMSCMEYCTATLCTSRREEYYMGLRNDGTLSNLSIGFMTWLEGV